MKIQSVQKDFILEKKRIVVALPKTILRIN